VVKDGDHEEPERFPYLLLALPLGAWLAFAAWQTVAGGESFLESLVWPGLAVLGGALAVAILGWKLDID
jgi:hypothetical protein